MSIFTRKLRLVAAAALVVGAVCLTGCGGEDNPTDNGGGGGNNCTSAEKCKSDVMPDGKTWLTENLNVKTADSWCYGNDDANCKKYGRLYTWAAAAGACRSIGWRLPDKVDWETLVDTIWETSHLLGGDALKSTSGWKAGGNGEDTYGFTALPGGWRDGDGSFDYESSDGNWWTDTEDFSNIWIKAMSYSNSTVQGPRAGSNWGLSVRCIKE